MTVSHQFLDTAHQFGLDNMGATAALNTLNQSILGDVLETKTSWTSVLQPGETGTITITFSNGFTRTSEVLNAVESGAVLKSITILRTDTNEVLWETTGDIPFSLTNFSAALQDESVYSGDDTISGNSFNNTFRGYLGDDSIDGGAGVDLAFYLGFAEDYTISPPANNSINISGKDGTDKLVNIERLQFDDTKLAFDLDGNAGHVANLIGAIFGKETLARKEYVGIGLDLLDNGMTYAMLTDLALNVRLGENYTVADEVSLLYQNLVGTVPSESDLNFWVNTVTTGQYTQTTLAQFAAESGINGFNIKRGALAQEGIEYADSGSSIALTEQNNIDSLLGDFRWGEGAGSGNSLSYSFRTELSTYSDDEATGYGPVDGVGEPWREGWVPLTGNQVAAIKSSLDTWADVANIRLTEVTDSDTASGDIRFSTLPEATNSTTYLPSLLDLSGNPTDKRSGDVWLSSSELGASLSEGSTGYATLLRETGHALGLVEPQSGRVTADSSNNTPLLTVMATAELTANPSSPVILLPTTPMLNDISAIQSIYGANFSTRSGDTVYSWSGGQTVFETIWDGGGVDTINWSNQFTPAVIDLNAGNWSFLGPERWNGQENTQQNLAIANDVLIENAIGGGRDDIITGNAADNILSGSNGDDEIAGGEGNDFLDWDEGFREGNDTLIGGPGNDSYVVDSAFDIVVELEDEGIDVVFASETYSIENAPHIENLFLFGDDAIDGIGNDIANLMRGNDSDNVINARNGRDTLIGNAGNDALNGGLDIDTAVFNLEKNNATLSVSEGNWTVSSITQDGEEIDTLTDVERFRFLDVNVAVDLDGNAGNVVKIIGAVFGKETLAREDFVGIGLDLFDNGTSYNDIMQLALNARLGEGFSDSDEVVLLYQNLLGIAPSQEDLNLWTGRLANGEFTQVSLAELAANIDINLVGINFVGLQQTGIEFI